MISILHDPLPQTLLALAWFFLLKGATFLGVLALVRLDQLRIKTALTDTTRNRVIDVLRVLIVENQLVLGAGLQSLLSGETDLDVIGISPRSQLELVQEIRQIQPDVVFLDKDSRLTDATDLLTFLEDFPELRVVVISANDNLARIYLKKQTLVTPTTQLISIVRDS